MRLGIIGPGLIWQKKHKLALAKLSSTFHVTAFCASSERLKTEAKRDFPDAPFETDLQAFLRRDDIEAVLVLTPIPLNASVAVAALRAGKDVFLEKPLAHSLAAGHEVVQAARQTGRQVWMLEQAVYQPLWSELKQLLRGNAIGDPVYFDQIVHWPIDANTNDRGGYGKTHWRIQPAYPLGHFFDGGPHQVAVLSTLFGVPEWVFATGLQLRPEFGEYDHIVMQVGYAPHLRGVLSHSSVLGEQHNRFTIWGTTGAVTIANDRLDVDPYQGTRRQIEIAPADAHEVMWGALERSIAKGEPPDYTLTQAWNDLRVLMAVERSIKLGQKIDLSADT